MNFNPVFSLPVAADASFDAHLRVTIDSNGNAVLAGANEKGIGHTIQPVNGANGRDVADIAKNSAVAIQFGRTTAAIAKGQRVIAAADGKIAPLLNGIMTDLDAAASTGVAVKIAAHLDGVNAYLNAVNAGTADSTFHIGASGPRVNVDYAASPAGVALYYDEDAVATGIGRLLCVSPTGSDLLVPVSNGTKIRVYHDASAASNGVQVYFDDDAATASARMLFVSPTNVSGVFTLDEITDNVSLAFAIEAAAGSAEAIQIVYR